MTAWSWNFEEFNHVTKSRDMWDSKKLFELSSLEYIFSQTCYLGFLNLMENEESPEATKTAWRNVIKVTGKYLFNWCIEESSNIMQSPPRVVGLHSEQANHIQTFLSMWRLRNLRRLKIFFDDPGEMRAFCKK